VANAGLSLTLRFASTPIFLLNAMTFLAVALGALIGSFLGNVSVFLVIGTMAKQAEKKQLQELQKMQQGYLDMVQREKARMENYAKLEG